MAGGLVLRSLERRWERWVDTASGARARRDWAGRDPAFAGWRVDELRTPTWSPRTDRMQAGLVRLAQAGDHDAATTLLVQLVPGMVTLARRVAATDPRFPTLDEAEAEVISAVGERIVTIRIDRRPQRVAANVLLDARQRLWRSGTRQARIDGAALAGPVRYGAAGPAPETVIGELDVVSAVSAALDRLPGSPASRAVTAELAYRAWVLDEPSGEIADRVGLGREAVSSRLCRLRSLVRRELAATAPSELRSGSAAAACDPVARGTVARDRDLLQPIGS